MFRAHAGIKNIPCLQAHCPDVSVFLVVHLYTAIHHRKNFLTVIDVPLVGLIRPVKPYGCAIKVSDVECTPGPVG